MIWADQYVGDPMKRIGVARAAWIVGVRILLLKVLKSHGAVTVVTGAASSGARTEPCL